MFISNKYMSRFFVYERKIYLWVSDHRQWNTAAAVPSYSWCVCWFCCGHWFRSTSSLSCRALALTRLWVRLDLVFVLFFSFLFIGVYFCFVLRRWICVVTLFHRCDLVWKSWISFFGL